MRSVDPISLRRATSDDADLLLDWANDPAVRDASVNADPIRRETHMRWLEAKLASPSVAFYICEEATAPIGYARVERRADGAGEIAVSVEADRRGAGLGRRLVALASARASEELGLATVTARVKPDNTSSLRTFEAAGFTARRTEDGLVWFERDDLPPVTHSRPFVGEAEAAAAAAVVRSGSLAGGAVAAELEQEWCAVTGAAAAVCVASGVSALRLGLHALGVGPGDEVIVPAYSCVALLNAPLALGAIPVLADVERDNWTLAVDDVARRVTERTRAIVAVDLFGMPARVSELSELGLPVVEDCAHGIGGRTSKSPFGSGSDVSISSFYATKMLGAGEGGIVAARDPGLIARVRAARDYGDQLPSPAHLNDKLSDVEAAVALVQLRRLDEILRLRAARADAYADALSHLEESGVLVRPLQQKGRIWYRYAVRVVEHAAPAVCARMAACGVHAEQPVWDLRACEQWRPDLERTAAAFAGVVSLPLYPDLTAREQERVCDVLADCLEQR
jgi:perosamine synthetase